MTALAMGSQILTKWLVLCSLLLLFGLLWLLPRALSHVDNQHKQELIEQKIRIFVFFSFD